MYNIVISKRKWKVVTENRLLTIKEASEWATNFTGKDVTISNIAYLIQYGRIKKNGFNGSEEIQRPKRSAEEAVSASFSSQAGISVSFSFICCRYKSQCHCCWQKWRNLLHFPYLKGKFKSSLLRLGVRTQGFHPCNRGSIPLGDVT